MSIPSFPPNRLRRRLNLKRENTEPEVTTLDETELVAPGAPKVPAGFSSTPGKSAFSIPSRRHATPYNGVQDHHYNFQQPLASAVINCNQGASTQKTPSRCQWTNCRCHAVPNGPMMNIVPPRSSIVPPTASEVTPRSSLIPPRSYIAPPRSSFVPPRPPPLEGPFAPPMPSVVPARSSIGTSIYPPAFLVETSIYPPASLFAPLLTSCVVPPVSQVSSSSCETNNVDENLAIRKKHHIPPRTEAAKTNAFHVIHDAPILSADSSRPVFANLDNSNEIRGGQNIHLNPRIPNATNTTHLRENREEPIAPSPLHPSQLCIRCKKYSVIFNESDLPDLANDPDYEFEIGRVPEGLFFVEKILKKRIRHGQEQYFVKWMSFPRCHNTWEPRPSFLNQGLVEAFDKKLQDKAAKKSRSGKKKRRQTRTR